MTLKGETKFKVKLIRGLENYKRIFFDFHAISWFLLSKKACKKLHEKVQKSDAKFEEKIHS